jgi:uracil phosphoribosyltransferase
VEVQTPLATATASIPTDDIVIGTVLRAGLPFHQGFLDIFDKAGNAFLSAYRYYTDRECRNIDVHIEYIASPNLNDCTFIIVDPMLATGESLELAYKAFLSKGKPKRIILASVIAAKEGIEHLQKTFPSDDVELYCAAIDPELNEHRYIVPGLGDAGDLMYGDKM